MQAGTFLLYGANGYTGELIARYAADYNLQPILAGRRKDVIEPLAKKLHHPYRVFDLNDTNALMEALKEVKVVIHAAGPFQYTAKQMVEACIRTGVHYLDINGDLSVFEMISKYDNAARDTGIMLLPGAGFDVVPTDCLALQLKKRMPDAISLQLAFASVGGGLSHGTASTVVARLGEKGAARSNGKIVRRPLGEKGMLVDFGTKELFVMTIPWGDVFTAYMTTGIPNIEVYTGIPKKAYRLLKFQPLFNWLLRTKFVRRYVQGKINRRPAGPSDEQRSKARSLIWGRVTNAEGETEIARMITPDGYTLTVHSSLVIVNKILNGNFKPGYQTPALAYGEKLVTEIRGVEKLI